MSISIYSSNDFSWDSAVTYIQHDIVKSVGVYWYCLLRNSNSTPTLTNANWGGQILDSSVNNEQKPYFYWQPSYGFNNSVEPKNKTISFGDQYSQVIKEGINNQMLNFDLSFDNRSLVEITAISHFLFSRQGTESFIWVPTTPFDKRYRFRCARWTQTANFYENYGIKAQFIQTPV